MRRKVNRFPDELKLRVVKEYFTTEISHQELKLKYGFKGNSTLYKWIDKFDIPKPDDRTLKLQETMSKEIKKSRTELDQEARIKKLESELAYEKLRTEALSTMIDIAEDQFKIAIRKKSGPKQ
jgi:transposase-like protein